MAAKAGFLKCERGAIMIEVAFFVPALMLILLAGADLVRLASLQEQADQAAAVIAGSLAAAPAIDEADFDAALTLGRNLTGEEGTSLSIGASRVNIDGLQSLWSRSRGEGDCGNDAPSLAQPAEPDPAAVGYYLAVDLCVTPDAGFFLSGLLASATPVIHGRAVDMAGSLALKTLN